MSEVGTGLATLKDLSILLPWVVNLLKESDNTAFDVWKETPINRLNHLYLEIQQIRQEYPRLQSTLTDNEKYSPISGINRTIVEYAYAVDDKKLELLRNALINGAYGDFTLELRHELYRMVNIVQPLDAQMLSQLVKVCPNVVEYQKLHQENERNEQQKAQQQETYYKTTLATAPFNERKEKTPTLDSFFPTRSLMELQISLDRLREAKLICNPRLPRFGFQTPYMECIPTTIAQTFLNFIADPRNSLEMKRSHV